VNISPSIASELPYSSTSARPANSSANTSLNSAFNEGVYGMQSATEKFVNAAQSIATSFQRVDDHGEWVFPNEADLAKALIDQRQAQLLFIASADVVSVSDELAGKIINEIV